jgi:hypothetical protein
MQAGRAAAGGYISRWRPWSVSPRAAAFARDVITRAGPATQRRDERSQRHCPHRHTAMGTQPNSTQLDNGC